MVARFRNEAVAAGRLTHPGIVTVYEICAYLPAIGVLAAFLPRIERARAEA